MFNNLQQQLETQLWNQKSDRDFYITQTEFDDFCKEFLFEELKGTKLGIAFCEKYSQTNYVLSILHNKAAKEHIKTFYIK